MMRILTVLLLAASAHAQMTVNGSRSQTGDLDLSTGTLRPPERTVATLPAAAGVTGRIFMVTDLATKGQCATGGGSVRGWCRSTGSAYEAISVTSAGSAGAVQASDGSGGLADSGCTASSGQISCTPAGGVAGMHAFPQGTANTPPANTVGFQAPTSVPSAYLITLPAAPAAGFVKRTNATPSVESIANPTATDVGLGSVTNDAQTKAAIVPNTAPSAGQILAGNAGGTAYAPVSVSGDATLSSTGAVAVTKLNGRTVTLPYGCAVGDPAGSALSTGVLCYIVIPTAGTIVGWDIVVDGGTGTVDVWKVATGTAKPTVTNTITASAKPAIATGTAIHSTTLTGWTTAVAANDIIGFNLDAVATAKFITVNVQVAH